VDVQWISTDRLEGIHYRHFLGFTMSQSAMLYEKLRDDIIAGKFPPGTRLPQRQIAKTYEVSKVLTVAAFARLEVNTKTVRRGASLILGFSGQHRRIKQVFHRLKT
jgi:DNA-binding transcriptional MocR family regulator